jgi:copper chaperone CopZ
MIFLLFNIALASADSLPAGRAVVGIEGMTCMSCEAKVTSVLSAIETVGRVGTSASEEAACLELTGDTSLAAINAAVASIDYRVTDTRTVDLCPASLPLKSRKEAWEGIENLDVQIISRGESVELPAHRTDGKFTVFDFGAPWCGPCTLAAKRLKAYLSAHPDTAVRAIVLDAPNPETSFAMPAAQQYLEWSGGLPYFEVYSPSGKRIYKGNNVGKAMASIDKAREG